MLQAIADSMGDVTQTEAVTTHGFSIPKLNMGTNGSPLHGVIMKVLRARWDLNSIKKSYGHRDIHRKGSWRDRQEQVYAEIYKCSRLLARVHKTACWAGYRHVPVINLPSLDVFKQAIMKVLFNVGSFASLGEEPGKFFDSVLGVFMTALLADAGVEGGAAMIVIDVMPPMATSVKAMHRGDNLVDYHHIDSIAYFKALPEGLQKIIMMNHDAIVNFFGH